jgi:hypothetical protein
MGTSNTWRGTRLCPAPSLGAPASRLSAFRGSFLSGGGWELSTSVGSALWRESGICARRPRPLQLRGSHRPRPWAGGARPAVRSHGHVSEVLGGASGVAAPGAWPPSAFLLRLAGRRCSALARALPRVAPSRSTLAADLGRFTPPGPRGPRGPCVAALVVALPFTCTSPPPRKALAMGGGGGKGEK